MGEPEACGVCEVRMHQTNIRETNLDGQRAIVTGANSGIGEAVARGLAEAGAAVVVNYVSGQDRAEQIVADIRARLLDPAAACGSRTATGYVHDWVPQSRRARYERLPRTAVIFDQRMPVWARGSGSRIGVAADAALETVGATPRAQRLGSRALDTAGPLAKYLVRPRRCASYELSRVRRPMIRWQNCREAVTQSFRPGAVCAG